MQVLSSEAQVLTVPPQMLARLQGLGPRGPFTSWIWVRVRHRSNAAIRRALDEALASDPIFRLALVRSTSQAWSLERRAAVPVPAVVDLAGLAVGRARRSVAHVADRIGRADTPALATTVFMFPVGASEHWVLLAMPTVWADRRTLHLAARRFARALSSPGLPDQARAPAPDYLEFLAWQREFLQDPRNRPMQDAWRARRAAHGRALSHDVYEGSRTPARRAIVVWRRRLDAGLVETVEKTARALQSSPAAIFGAAWGLHVVSEFPDLPETMGWEISGRFTEKLETALGLYAVHVPVTVFGSPEDSFGHVLRDADTQLSFALEHQEYYGTDADFEGVESRGGFGAVFAFEDDRADDTASFAVLDDQCAPIRFRIRLRVQRRGAGWDACLDYDVSACPHWQAPLVLTRCLERLRFWAANPDIKLSQVEGISARDRHCVLTEWNDTTGEAEETPLVPERLRTACERYRDRVALVSPEETWTYGMLQRRASAVARRLSDAQVGRGACVALFLERSPDAIAAMLGALQAGAAYVPVSPDHPPERIASIVADCRPAAAITSSRAIGALPPFSGRTILLDDLDTEDTAEASPRCQAAAPDDAAYVLYTSGSTGRPKGVVITHANLAQSLLARLSTYRAEEPGFFLASPLVFDSSVAGIYWTLAIGGRLCLPPDRIHDRFEASLQLLRAGRVTHALYLPSLYRLILEHADAALLENFEAIILAGEELPRDVVDLHRRHTSGAELFNEYGLTEASVWSTVYRVPAMYPSGRISIGRSVPGARVYVLDATLEVCAAGREGDLYLGGSRLSPGYLRLPAETASKFVPDPFAGVSGARMCRTGDRARWRADGNLEFLGRADRQVKVRGVRFELGELEHLLLRQPWIEDAAVTATPSGGGELRIHAFVVARPNDTRAGDLEGLFRGALPPQLLPIPVTMLERLPRTASGKVDRARLVPPTRAPGAMSPADGAGASPVAELVGNLWRAQLGLADISPADSFWALGGDSVKAIPIVAGIQRLFGVELGLRALFETPALGALARRVESAMRERHGQVAAPAPAPGPRAGSPLSFAQRRLWFLETLQPGRTAYHCPLAIRIDAAFSVRAWEETLAEIARRQESLRTAIDAGGDGAELRIQEPAPRACACVDLSGIALEHQDRVWARLSRADAARPFDLEREPAWRQRVVRFGARRHGILLNFHHIICDLWSMEILIGDINTLYPTLAAGRVHTKRPLERTYSDFARWQHASLAGERGAALIARWRALLGPFTAVAEIPADFPRPRRSSGRGGRLAVGLGPALSARVVELARTEQATPFLVFLAACHAMVACSAGSRDVCVGVPVANRAWPGAEEIVGLLLNTLPIPARLSPTADFRGLLGAVRDTFLDAFAAQDLPFEAIVEALGVRRDPGRNPLFQVFFTYQHRLASDLRLPGAEARPDEIPAGAPKFDLTVGVVETAGGFNVAFEYDGDLFAPASVARMAHLYRHLIARVCDEPSLRLEWTRLVPAHQRHQLLTEWNDTASDWGAARSLHGLFGEVARCCPERVALIEGAARLTFGALDAWSDEIAARLEALDLAPGDAVGVWLPRSARAVAAMLGALKAGLLFVPLDPDTPPARLRQAADATGMRVALGDGGPRIADCGSRVIQIVPVDEPSAPRARPSAGATHRTCDAAYVLFTSGSTDRPKGVRGSHRAIVNRFQWMWEKYPVGPGEVFCSKAPLTFVDSLWEVFGGLLQGVPLVILAGEVVRDPRALIAELRAHEVSRVVFIPSFLRLLLESVPGAFAALPSLRHVTVSGEPLEPSVCRLFHRASGTLELLNLYGMTEAAADVTWHVARPVDDASAPVPIGRPLANITAYLLDSRLDPVGVGVPAELYIGGDGLADGYCGAPDTTAARFVPHPFPRTPGQRLYRTGDLCAWQTDGRLRYLGRCDRQLKVRGMRVEPVEIEERIRAHPGVVDAVVRGVPSTAGVRLIAYVRLEEPPPEVRALTAAERAEMRQFLASTLPSHMIPSEIVAVPSFPRTASGKIDSRRLPLPEEVAAAGQEPGGREESAASDLERRIQCIWKTVLRRETVPLDANFFDVGGNSFHLIQVQDRLKTELGMDVQVFDMFAYPNVKDFAAFVVGARDDGGRRRALVERVDHRRAAITASRASRRR